MKDVKVDSSLPTVRLVLAALVTVLSGGFHFGFQISIVNPMSEVFQEFLLDGITKEYNIVFSEQQSSLLWSLVASEVLIGALFGAATVTRVIEKEGSLKSLYYSSIIQMVSVLLMSTSGFVLSPVLFVVSRLVSGFAIGMSATAHGVFLTEISPVEHRGKIGTLSGLSTSIGFIAAAALGLPFALGTKEKWPVIFIIEAIPCMIFIASSGTWITESPAHFCRRSEVKNAEISIRNYYGSNVSAELEVIQVMKSLKSSSQSETSIWELLEERETRKALHVSIAVNVAVSFSGITAVSFFGTSLLRSLGFSDDSAALSNLLCSFAGIAGAIVATTTTDKIGSRCLILSSLLLLITLDSLMMLFVFAYSMTQETLLGWVFLSLFILFLLSFSAGIGPAAWSIGAELAPVHSRSMVQAVAVSTQYVACFLSPIIYYPLSSMVGSLSFLVFIVPLLLITLYLHYSLSPSSKNKSRKEIDANGNSIIP